ncbi:hypothetical protein FisN_25Hh020 [Fistulifera solaris]|uniref:Uncharacterized protein n=1 Tax=Fistulifera solaris TaxID=1519565 RepID=A0A1Z5JVZ2_FISSO|nr:hypothetical protein FisN_25Hh020 [Fistulifera solaris]|eukprot:GAX18046.1 hypothetical protein FisN_25Hh020 [Fistulifera solaris]
MMNRCIAVLLFLVSSLSFATSRHNNGWNHRPALVARSVPRGGGLFNNNNKKDEEASKSVSSNAGGQSTYPPMSQQEIEEWMEHIPVFAVTDQTGAGVVLKPENDSSVFYFFLNPLQANATLGQLQASNAEMDLKVSAFSLGKIYFDLLQKQGKSEDAVDASSNTVQYRLVPDSRDLLGARMLLTMSPEDGEKLKESGSMTPEMAQAAVQKAMTESPKFKESYNEIPVFTIAQMRMQKTDEKDATTGEPLTLLPMYFSLQNMVSTWQQFMSQAPAEVQGTEPAINLMSLHDLVELMQKESEIDFRHVVLVPMAPSSREEARSSGSVTATPTDPMARMGGATLGDE